MNRITIPLLALVLASVFLLKLTKGSTASGASDLSNSAVARVVTVSQDGLDRKSNDLLEPTMSRLDAAGSFHPDIACLPEVFSNRAPESVPGPVTEKLAAWAHAHHSYVIFGLKTTKAGRTYNSAILLDRKGEIVGQYNKAHPTEEEVKGGTTPGDDSGPPIFPTDFGRIGLQICFDVNWRDGWHRLKSQGADIVFWPSAYPAGRQLPALALSNELYIVSSTQGGASHIYDITGETLASSEEHDGWAGAALPLGKRLFEVDYNAAKAPQIQQKYGSRVEITWYHDSDWFTLASLDPQVTVQAVVREFGLIPLDEYIASSSEVINTARAEAEHRVQP